VTVERAVPASRPLPPTRGPDADSRRWLRALSGSGPTRDEAVERLHALLLRAARTEVARREAVAERGSGDLDDLAVEAADDALLAVLSKLSSYRGTARFTTWAYKFALLEASVRLRRRTWSGRELPAEAEGWARLPDPMRDAIAVELSPHQRAVLVALALNDVPIDVLAERQGTTRDALYKTLHDSRRKLRSRLQGEREPT
jgi:RNA polymerase sigma-70 factor (ECF subfamily)